MPNSYIVNSFSTESPMPPKTRALDTILCLDTSSSMGQKGLKEMKDIAFGFIDGIQALFTVSII